MDILLFIIGVFLFVELTFGWEANPKKKLYNYLFKPRIYLGCLLICVLIAIIGLKMFKGSSGNGIIATLIPIHYLLIFKMVDVVSQRVNGRHIIISARGDFRSPSYNWVDTLLSVLLLTTSAIFPLLEVVFLLRTK